MDRRAAFNEVIKGAPRHKVEIAFSRLTHGVDWRGAGMPSIRNAFADGAIHCPGAKNITPERLAEALAELTGDR